MAPSSICKTLCLEIQTGDMCNPVRGPYTIFYVNFRGHQSYIFLFKFLIILIIFFILLLFRVWEGTSPRCLMKIFLSWTQVLFLLPSGSYYTNIGILKLMQNKKTNLEQTPLNRSQQLPAPYKRLIDEIKQN